MRKRKEEKEKNENNNKNLEVPWGAWVRTLLTGIGGLGVSGRLKSQIGASGG